MFYNYIKLISVERIQFSLSKLARIFICSMIQIVIARE
jgi:hypothetical protein